MSDMKEIPPIFDIDAFDHSLEVEEIDWTHSEESASLAFKYGWVRASDAKDLIEKINRLRARVEVLERALSGILEFCEEGHRAPYVAIANIARSALKDDAP